MNTETVILGYDLGNEYTQISCLYTGAREPETLSTVSGEDKFQIPTMTGKVKGSDRWVFGTEAKKLTVLGEGAAVDRLVERCIEKESAEIEGENYEPIWLLSSFLSQTMQFVRKIIGSRPIIGLMFTVPELSEDIASIIRSAASHMGIAKELISLQDYQESFYHYVVNGERELWNHNVALFTYEQNRIDLSMLSTVVRNRMQYVSVEQSGYMEIEPFENRPEYGDERLNREKDAAFAAFVGRHFGRQLISSVYLIGDGFDGEWMEETLKVLCAGRRVFLGKNLYTKGACYGGLERTLKKAYSNRIYCAKHKVMSDVGLRMRVKGTEGFHPLARAGRNWFDSNNACEFILTGSKVVELEVKSYLSGEVKRHSITLEDLPDRPAGTMRLRLELLFLSEGACKAVFSDVGFGDMYPATEFQKQCEIALN